MTAAATVARHGVLRSCRGTVGQAFGSISVRSKASNADRLPQHRHVGVYSFIAQRSSWNSAWI